jgi:acyl-CoA synthetase (NDP forming)
VLVVLGNCDRSAGPMIAAIVGAYKTTTKPFHVSWTGGSGQPRRDLLAAGVPTYADPERAVRTLAHLVDPSLRRTESTAGT